MRISLRLRLSSKRAAKDSAPEACAAALGEDFWDCAAGEMLAIKGRENLFKPKACACGVSWTHGHPQGRPPVFSRSRHQPTIRSTTSSIESADESSTCESGAGTSG